IDADHGFVVVEKVLGQGAHEFGLADPGGPEKDEAADGPVGVAESGAVAQDGVGHQLHGLVLAHHAVLEALGHLHQLLDFALHHTGDRDAGPLGDDAGDILLVDLLFEQRVFLDGFHQLLGRQNVLLDLREAAVAQLRGLFPIAGAAGFLFFLAQRVLLFFQGTHAGNGVLFVIPAFLQRGGLPAHRLQFVLQVAQAFVRGRVLLFAERLALDFQVRGAAVQVVDFDGHGADLQAQRGARFVDQVERLIGQEAVGNIAVREHGGRENGRVLNAHSVVDLEFLLEAAQNGDGVVHGRLAHHHGTETARQGGVLFDVLAVLVEGRGPDAAQFSASQRRLEEVGGVDRAFRRAGPDEGVQFVDKADDFAVGIDDFLDHRLETVFELAAELGAGDHAAQVDGHQLLVLKLIRYVAADDALGQAFYDGGLADTRFADQHRVVLGAAAEHLHDAADLVVAGGHRGPLAL